MRWYVVSVGSLSAADGVCVFVLFVVWGRCPVLGTAGPGIQVETFVGVLTN